MTRKVLVRTRVLFVDDEPSLRLTLPAILEQHGFKVTAAGTVADALNAINSEHFEALVADLNIGEPGDGFTVVSAMRRTQPQCINLILTGYPAFESALQAIRTQVDDFLVKPADIHDLVESLRDKLKAPRQAATIKPRPLATFLREHADEIVTKALAQMKSHPRLCTIRLTDEQRVDHIPDVIREIALQLESARPDEPTEAGLRGGRKHGHVRRRQGYTQGMLVDDVRVLDTTVYEVLQSNLLSIELSNLIPDLSRFNDTLEAQLQMALRAFGEEKAA